MKHYSSVLFISFFLVFSSVGHAVEFQGTVSAGTNTSGSTTNRIIIKYLANSVNSSNLTAASVMLNDAINVKGISLRHHHNMSGFAQVWQLSKAMSVAEVRVITDQIALDSSVEYAEPDIMLSPMLTPNDSRYNEQWHYFESTAGLNLPLAWDKATGQGVVVAVIDTGYLPHADLANNILPGYDMISSVQVSNDGDGRDNDARDPGDAVTAGQCGAGRPARFSTWHGTHVAGTVAALTNNNLGVAGIAFNAKIVPLRVLGRCGGFISDIADAIIWAAGGSVAGTPTNANPAKVLNMSLGGTGSCSTTLQNAINQANTRGATVVVAAGNSNADASNHTPANCNNVITVAAVDRTGGRAWYSNFGSIVDIAAPGGDTRSNASDGVLSTLNTGQLSPASDSYNFYQGTSMAAPHIAGLAALLYSAKSSLNPAQVQSAIVNNARSFPATCNQCGAGIADATAAVNAVLGGGGGGGGNSTVLKNGVAVSNLAANVGKQLHYTMVIPAGATNLKFRINSGSGDADIYVKFGAKPTLNSYDYRPYLIGNNETVTVSNVQSGTYYVMLHAYESYSGVTLTGSFTPAGSQTGKFFENTTDYMILLSVESPITVNRNVAAGNLAIGVDIKHSFTGDLVIDLISPSGKTTRLKNSSSSSTSNLRKTYNISTQAENSGVWRLIVMDNLFRDIGFIDSWSITLP